MSVRFSLEQFPAVVGVCNENGKPYVMIGGQAVYFGASGYVAVERVIKIAESAIGKKAARKFSVNWREALPENEIAASRHWLVMMLCQKRLPQWLEKRA